MAMLKIFSTIFALIGVVKAYPFENNRWDPDEIADYLSERTIPEPASPVQNISFDTDNQGLGTVSSVDVDTMGNLYVFHRADRPWTKDTFNKNNELLEAARAPIVKDTIFKMNPNTGRLISSFGGNFFNVPHGLTIDSADNFWLTDVGRHQVFRFPKNSTKPDLVLGEKFVPGNDDSHFCKPTDVAVVSNGDFFVADGYCNSRVLKFSKDGKLVTKWGTKTSNGELTPFTLNTPHSLTLVEELDLICVADRENNRALCYNAGLNTNKVAGTFNRTLVPQDDVGRVFAIYYNKADNDVIVAAEISLQPYEDVQQEIYPARAFTYGLDGQQKDAWAYITPESARNQQSLIHDVCASRDGQDFFLADIYQQRVIKYTQNYPSIIM